MPGHARREDVTAVLIGQGSWPSYNIPYFKDIWLVGGYKAMQEANPERADAYSFETDPRAKMFARARAQEQVTDLQSFMGLLRYNRLGDPLAAGDACNGISSRCDLNPSWTMDYDCFGGTDGKVASFRQSPHDLSFVAVSGPTHDHQERPFSWAGQNASVDGCRESQHVGHPETFDFPWYALPSRVPAGLVAEELHDARPSGRLRGTAALLGGLGCALAIFELVWMRLPRAGRHAASAAPALDDTYVRIEA